MQGVGADRADIFQIKIKLPHEPFEMPMTVRTKFHYVTA
jgi:hypothetical protein